mgnify:CR=1 FL=1
MKNYKKILSVVMTAAMAASLAACGNSTANTSSTTDAAASDAAQTSDAAATESGAGTSSDGKKYTIGICQQLEHPALDQATQGFEDALTELLGSGNVTFDLQNAQGEQATGNNSLPDNRTAPTNEAQGWHLLCLFANRPSIYLFSHRDESSNSSLDNR